MAISFLTVVNNRLERFEIEWYNGVKFYLSRNIPLYICTFDKYIWETVKFLKGNVWRERKLFRFRSMG